ncbi:MAG: ABC transporter substrate-binding protein [Solirubrobacteraceae bacterium]
MRKYLYICIALAAATLLVAGCGSSGKAASSTKSGSSQTYAELRWGFPAFPGPIDYVKSGWFAAAAIQHLAVQNLVEFTSDGSVKPALASSIERSGPTTYVFKLRPGIKFSDGRPLTVADVVYSLEHDARGKESVLSAYWEDMSSVSAQGNSVVVKLKRPNASWLGLMAYSSQVFEKADAEKVGEKALGTPGYPLIGTGPWKIDSFKPEASVELSRNPYWTGPKQPAEKISITIFKEESATSLALRSGAIDGTFIILAPKVFTSLPGNQELSAPGATTMLLGMDTEKPPFNDVHVRRAIAYAIDAPAIAKALFGDQGSPLQTILPPSILAYLGTPSQVKEMLSEVPKYEFNLAKAKEELAKSAYPHGFTTELQAQTAERSNVLFFEALVPYLAKIGIKATVHEIHNDEVAGWLTKKTTAAISEEGAAFPDPESIFLQFLPASEISPPGSGANFARYKNPAVDKLYKEQSEALNPATRRQLMGKMLTIIANEAAYVGLLTHTWVGWLSEKYVFPSFSWWATFGPWALDVKKAS